MNDKSVMWRDWFVDPEDLPEEKEHAMKTLRAIIWVLSWYVMTFTGQEAAGPYKTRSQCEQVAFQMSLNNFHVQLQCQERLP